MGNGLEMKFTEPLGGIQQAGAPKTAVKSITPIVLLAVIDYDYIESNHNYNRNYMSWNILKKKTQPICMVSCKYIFRQHTIRINAINEMLLWTS